jgi:histidyl-tRNA synthetase
MKKNKHKGLFQSPKGMHDILPQDEGLWEKIRQSLRSVAEGYNFRRIDTTLLESSALFEKSLGSTSDVVEKQMFALKTLGGDSLVLRPEGTAGIARAYIEHGLSQLGSPLKLYYMGPMFRYEQPQAGRFRQFYQAGFEIMGGDDDSIYDAQVMVACIRLFEALKLKGVIVRLNTIGCKNCRPLYKKRLSEYYRSRIAAAGKNKVICPDCERRLAQNPLRLLDCKNDLCQEIKKDAPVILNGLCVYCKNHFKAMLEYVEELKIPYVLDNFLVRGLDYYNRTVFEFFMDDESGGRASYALGGGGRYDYLIEMLGGRPTPAVGGAIGLERVIEVLRGANSPASKIKSRVFLIHIGDLAKKKSLALLEELRAAGVDVAESLGKESLRGQLKMADKSGAPFALIFGQKEALETSIIIRDLQTGAQETVPLHKMAQEVKRRLK